MKTIIFPVILLLSIFLNTYSFAKNFEVGIGFTLEHPYNAQFEFQQSLTLHKLYFPVTIDSNIRLVPELAYWDAESDLGIDLEGYDDNKYSILQIGIGFYYLLYFDAAKIYFGPRYTIIKMKAPPSPIQSRISEKTDKIYALTFGSEYPVLEKLNIGFEIQLL